MKKFIMPKYLFSDIINIGFIAEDMKRLSNPFKVNGSEVYPMIFE